MYPDKKLDFLSEKSCSNFYKLMRDINNNPCCLALGAGASATVGIPVWSLLLKKICHCYFEQWAAAISSGKEKVNRPPSEVSIALTESYKIYMLEKEYPELASEIENSFDNVKYLSEVSHFEQ